MGIDISPLVKYGLMLSAAVAVFFAIFYAGVRYKQTQWDAAVMEQAAKAADEVIAQARNTAEKEKQFADALAKAKGRTKIVEKEVIRYVQTATSHCALSPEFEHAYDSVTSLLNESPDGLRPAAGATGATAQPASPAVTDVEVLSAHEALVIQYRDLWLTYRALVEWVRSTYQLQQKEFAP